MKTHRNLFFIVLTAFLILIASAVWGQAAELAEPLPPASGTTTRVSVASDGTEGICKRSSCVPLSERNRSPP